MKTILSLFLLASIFACKNDVKEKEVPISNDPVSEALTILEDSLEVTREDVELNKHQSIQIKQQQLFQLED